jgi:hypothetical protein
MQQQQKQGELDEKKAELLARQINAAFSTTTSYGPTHPLTQRGLENCMDQLLEALKATGSLTMMFDRDALFVEQHQVDKKFNPRRLTAAFKKIGLQSITFDASTRLDDLKALLIVLGDNNTFPTVDAAKEELAKRKAGSIRLNYITFAKVTADETVVNADDIPDVPLQGGGSAADAVAGDGATGAVDVDVSGGFGGPGGEGIGGAGTGFGGPGGEGTGGGGTGTGVAAEGPGGGGGVAGAADAVAGTGEEVVFDLGAGTGGEGPGGTGIGPGGAGGEGSGGPGAGPGTGTGVAEPEKPLQQMDPFAQQEAAQAQQAFITLENESLSQLTDIFTLKSVLEDPGKVAGSIVDGSGSMTDEQKADVVSRLKEVRRQIQRGDTGEQAISLDAMMEAVYKLRNDLKEGVEAQKAVGKFLEVEGAIVDEVDQLTYQAIVRLVREEYRAGNLKVKRLAQIIRRAVPDARDLKRLLPQLKSALLAEGMPLAEYLQLVNELNQELSSEGLVQVLAEGAEDIGLSVDEIVQTIRDNPSEAARVLVLAAELQHSGTGDEAALSDALTATIEKVSTKIALNSPEAATRDGGKALRNVVFRSQKELVERVKEQQELKKFSAVDVEQKLSDGFQKTVDEAKSEWLVGLAAKSDSASATEMISALENSIERSADLKTFEGPIRQLLAAYGNTPDKVQEICTGIAERLEKRTSLFNLPRNVLSANNTTYFLQRQIKMVMRYNTPFSCMMLSVPAAKAGESWRTLDPKEFTGVLPQLFKVLTTNLRDLDYVGALGGLDKTIPFVILPMTEEPGAEAARMRLQGLFDQQEFTLGSDQISLRVAISATGYDMEQKLDLKAYVQAIRQRHAAEEQQRKVD